MSNLLKKPDYLPSGEIVAENVSAEDYLAHYTGTEIHYEWVEGFVIQMSPNTEEHLLLIDYLYDILRAYLWLNPIGKVRREFAMKLVKSFREPDIFLVLNSNPNSLTRTIMLGAPDICIEVVSDESSNRDYKDKLAEYEQLGVYEYWIIDSLNRRATFYRLHESSYVSVSSNAEQIYQTPLLPKLKFHIETFWQAELPDYYAVGEMVKAMWMED